MSTPSETSRPLDVPSSAIAIRSCRSSVASAGNRIATYCTKPARPMPMTLPVTSSAGDAALISSSMTRLVFSATTPAATHMP